MTILDNPIGTTHAEYDNSPNGRGPYRCDNCIHYHKVDVKIGKCDHPDVLKDAKAKSIECDEEGHAVVKADRCCRYFR